MTAQHSFTARIEPADGALHHIVSVFAGAVLDDGRPATRASVGRLTMRPEEAAAFVALIQATERQRMRRVVSVRARTLERTLDGDAVWAKATELHDAECRDMPGCAFGVTGTWLMLARSHLATEAAQVEFADELAAVTL